ncbi:MAG TPA: hypothetical protein VGX68_14320 [Thermoanaerobaculia bacterium]|jgi:hypothetical protein|nr:hypothetical protein [Thermoanaerobaculia bacterium]
MTLQRLVFLILAMLVLQVGILLVLVRRWWPQLRTFYSTLHRLQKMALAVAAFGLATGYLFAFAAGAFFGAGHMAPPRCFTLEALQGDERVRSASVCLGEKKDRLDVPLPQGVTRILILEGQPGTP